MDEVLKLLKAGGTAAASAVNPYAAALNAGSQLFQLGTSVFDAAKARKLEKSQSRPVLETPAAQQEALATQRNLAMGNAPGLSVAQNQLAQNFAGSAAAIQGSGGGQAETLAALTRLDQNAGNQAMNLASMQDNWRATQQQNLINELHTEANWQKAKFDYNQDEPYRNAMAAAQQLRDAAKSNAFEAIKGIGGTVASTIGYNQDGGSSGGGEGAKASTGLAGDGLSGVINGRKADPSKVEEIPLNERLQSLMPEQGALEDRMRGLERPGFDSSAGADEVPDLTDAQAALDARNTPVGLKDVANIPAPEGLAQRMQSTELPGGYKGFKTPEIDLSAFGGAASSIQVPRLYSPPTASEQDIEDRMAAGQRLYDEYNEAQNPYGQAVNKFKGGTRKARRTVAGYDYLFK